MAKFGTKEEILDQIKDCFDKMSAGKLSLSELEDLVQLTATLHERSVILKYKAIEAKIFESTEENTTNDLDQLDDEIEQETLNFEEEHLAQEVEEKAPETPTIDFSFFNTDESTIVEDLKKEPEIQTPAKLVETPEIEKPVIENIEKPKVESMPAGNFADKMSFDEHMSNNVDNSLAGKLQKSKLESLVGSFGMNERLQYINELFDGSSEDFSEAVKSLDAMNSLDEARKKAISYGEKFSWDIDSETVGEFMQKIDRRYA